MSNELVSLAETRPNGRGYSNRLATLPFPSLRTMFTDQKKLLQGFQHHLTNIDECTQIAKEYTKSWPKNTDVIISVNAGSINPYVTLFRNKTVKGLLEYIETETSQILLNPNEITISVFEDF